MSRASIAVALLSTCAFAGTAAAQCEGTGAVLDLPTTVAIGDLITAQMHADPPATTILLFSSLGDGPVDAGSYGTLCLDFPPILQQLFLLDQNGDASFTDEIPCDAGFIGQTFYVQFITCSPGKGRLSHGASNMVPVTIVDGIGSDSFCTWTQEDFNLECSRGGAAGCLLQENFAKVFPAGVMIGDQDGNLDNNCYSTLWDNPNAIENYLMQDTGCSQLTGDHRNPRSESGFRFGAELLVAKLNVGFDDAGIYDGSKCRVDLKVGDLLFVGCVDEDLIGWKVRDLIDLCDAAISCELGKGPFDIDGDRQADVTCDDLMEALAAFNANFRACAVDEGCLGIDS
ncbi:MAG: hypothetical protein JNL90_17495 [Planctomycetes bacterium]|nr:hypothetical protein [Planctomycetota bacterium]